MTLDDALMEAGTPRVVARLHEYMAPHPQLGDDYFEDGRCHACYLIERAAIEALFPPAREPVR